MLWHIIRYLTTFIMPIFYKRIGGTNVHHILKKGPVIIAMNHPNAFADPILFTYVTYPARVSYLARGDAFKPGIASWLLEQIGVVPIFRLQDGGKEGLKKNDEAYRRVNSLLKRNGKIIIFAEGLCVQERRLRPLKKGVCRMVFGAYEFLNDDRLTVIPVGINYSEANKFRSTVYYNIGEPIYVKDYIEAYKNNPAKTNNLFLHDLEPRMKELITHINNKEYDEVVLQVEHLCKKDMLKSQGLDYKNLKHDYEVTKQITEKVNLAEIENKVILDEFKEKAALYFKEVKKNKLRDWLLNPNQNKVVTPVNVFLRLLGVIAGFPLFIVGLMGNYAAYKATELIAKKSVKKKVEFFASVALGAGMVILWLNYIIWFYAVYYFSPNIFMPLFVCLILALCGWFCLYFYPFLLKTISMLRAVKKNAAFFSLTEKRGELMNLINKF